MCCVSLGFTFNGAPVVGVVYNPFLDQLYSAAKGHGAFFNLTTPLPLISPPPVLPSLSQALIGVECASAPSRSPSSSSTARAARTDRVTPSGRPAHPKGEATARRRRWSPSCARLAGSLARARATRWSAACARWARPPWSVPSPSPFRFCAPASPPALSLTTHTHLMLLPRTELLRRRCRPARRVLGDRLLGMGALSPSSDPHPDVPPHARRPAD